MKNEIIFERDQQYQEALESIKTYLSKLPFLASPIKGKPLDLYTVT